MNILIVCSGNTPNFDFQKHQAFIYDQIEAIKIENSTINFDCYFIKGKGIKGYLSSLGALKNQIKINNYDVIHAHFAHSALLANLQRKVPVIATFHGSDINNTKGLSLLVEILSKKTIYVSQKLLSKAIFTISSKNYVIPCGVDFDIFKPLPKEESKKKLGLEVHKKYILFSSSFSNGVKNYPLAKAAFDKIANSNIELIELKGYSRQEVALLFTAVDVALMTSFSEGSPQFIKEAMACNIPIVSVNVGDVADTFGTTEGTFLCDYEADDVADKLKKALNFSKTTDGREKIACFNNKLIAAKIYKVYTS